ncbi:MAG: trigger factor [Firmicutes bacterium HGW-Firmicutes-1]|jgi:trigger factor|nr:MAG: trigger factor [Firmicutes bacterium HGW-Firmicutes-1]
MSTKVEVLENSMVKLTIEVDAARFEEGMQNAYNKNKGKMTVQGFRKGKAPRQMIEKIYGPEVLYDDAANYVIPEAYDNAVEENNLEVVSRPEIDIEQIEKGNNFIFTALVAVKPEIELGQYKGIEVAPRPVEVTEEDINAEIEKVREQNSRIVDVTDRRIVEQDKVTIDFEGFVHGIAFEGGTAENHELTIGSHSFIDTFEEQLIDKALDEEVDVLVVFPEEYHVEALQGQPANFKVKIKGIKAKELPVVDDEFARDVSEFETLDEYKASLKETIKERKEKSAVKEKQEEVLTKLVDGSKIDLPEPMVDLEAENMTHEFAHRLQYQGLNIEQYFSYTGQNMATLKEAMKKEAETKIKVRLVLEGVANAEGFVISDEDYIAEMNKMAELYQMEFDKLSESIGEDEKASIQQDMMNQRALDLITDTAIEK